MTTERSAMATGPTWNAEAHVARLRAGGSAALAALYDQFGADLYRLAHRLTGSRPDAEDVVHDVFVGLPEALARYEERGQLGAWLKRVTTRVALMRLRASDRRREVRIEAAAGVPLLGGDPVANTDLQRAIVALPEHLRLVLVLKEVEGYSHDEVAGALGITVGASRVRLVRALKMLRRALGGS